MGMIIRYGCSCGYTKELMLGTGINSIKESSLEGSFPDQADMIKSRIASGAVQSFLVDKVAAVCENCGNLFSADRVILSMPDGKKGTLLGTCPVCSGKAELVKDEENPSCPLCGKRMTSEIIGYWD